MKTKIEKWLRKDVTIKTSHLWIIGLGLVVGLGFLVNCAVAPFYQGCTPIDEEQLILSASIIAGLGTAREVVLYRFKYLREFITSPSDPTKKLAEDVLRERIWVPCVGWALVLGFAVNMLLVPFFSWIRPVDWSFLQASIAMFLTVSGARETGIYKKIDATDKEIFGSSELKDEFKGAEKEAVKQS